MLVQKIASVRSSPLSWPFNQMIKAFTAGAPCRRSTFKAHHKVDNEGRAVRVHHKWDKTGQEQDNRQGKRGLPPSLDDNMARLTVSIWSKGSPLRANYKVGDKGQVQDDSKRERCDERRALPQSTRSKVPDV